MLLGAHEALISSNAWLVGRLKAAEVSRCCHRQPSSDRFASPRFSRSRKAVAANRRGAPAERAWRSAPCSCCLRLERRFFPSSTAARLRLPAHPDLCLREHELLIPSRTKGGSATGSKYVHPQALALGGFFVGFTPLGATFVACFSTCIPPCFVW